MHNISEASGLTFDRGEIIEVLACLESGWWNGLCGSNRGWFPSNYVEHVSAEQVSILRQGQHLQHQQLPSTPTTPMDEMATADQTLLTAAANESIIRRGSIAVGEAQAGSVASAVPSRLRMGRRPSTPFNAVAEGSSDAGQQQQQQPQTQQQQPAHQPVQQQQQQQVQTQVQAQVQQQQQQQQQVQVQPQTQMQAQPQVEVQSQTRSDSVDLGSTTSVAQWESRVTLDGRTYFCNIFTDRTAWSIGGGDENDGAEAARSLELIGDQATLVYVSLVLGAQIQSQMQSQSLLQTQALVDEADSAWEQLASGVALAAFNLAAAVSTRAKHECMALLAVVVSGVKRLLLASAAGGAMADGPIFRTHRVLRDNHREIVQHMCALTLSAKVASTVWPPPDAADAVHADVAGLVRAVRSFAAEAGAVGITPHAAPVGDESVTLLPGVDLGTGLRLRAASFGAGAGRGTVAVAKAAGSSNSAKRLSMLQRNEYTGATVLVRGDSATVSSTTTDVAGAGESLFARDRTGIRQRLRQHLAEHHQRTSAKATAAARKPDEAEQQMTATSADVLLQLDESTHELARVILALDRFMHKIERAHAENAESSIVASAPRLVGYAKHLVAALAVLLQVLDDFDAFSSAVVTAAENDDPDAALTGPATLIATTMDALRISRARVNDSVGFLVAAAQDFSESVYVCHMDVDADAEDEEEDVEIPADDSAMARVPPADRVLSALTNVEEALQALNHNAMALHISAKRVIEACDVCDLRVLWLRVAKYHAAPNTLASVPGGPGAALSGTATSKQPASRYGYRRSSSLPQLRRQNLSPPPPGSALPIGKHNLLALAAAAASSRPRADTIDTSDAMPVHLARRTDSDALADDDSDGAYSQAFRDARVKDKLNRFFGDDPATFASPGSQSRRPAHLEDLSITPVSSHQPDPSRTPTRTMSGYGDEPSSARAGSIMSSRSSTAPSTKGVAAANGSTASPGPNESQQHQTPWYLGYDYTPEEMILTADGQVKGSTLTALIERLVAHDVSDSNFVTTFLLTYHSFTTTPELFDGLFRRFLIQPPLGLTEIELADWTDRKLKPVRLRVYNFFKTWLEQHYIEQVEGDPVALEMLREFACTTMAEHMSKAAEQLVRLIDKRRASQGGLRKMVPNMPNAAPAPILPRSLSRLRLMDINPQELARQFTLIDSNLFNKVRPIECLKTAWSRKPGDPKAFNGLNTEIAVNVKAMSTLSTQTTLWVTANILLEHEIKRRAAVIKYFISFAEHCRNLNNFNTLMSVLGALTSVPVERLTRTWQAVHQKSLVAYNTLKQIMRTDRNFAEYRDSLHSCNPPAIPFVGVYLQDLTFIEDGNDDMIPSSRLINFAKRQRTSKTIRDLQQFQNIPYNLTPVAEIQDWLLKRLEELCPNGQSSDRLVEEFWKMSTTLEPKEKDSERVLRLLKESGFL
ncbi:hypothetical protein LPJ66_005005 [Kickxella alabastrina]|uniref:Uncharacterized protein n=1 Tax=Kickxella alabastrina TaxID=61397 RepID=A0ACC1IK34_9FUNG|nr:hypothetical protein LPJ66_005005 [Kickxella alabastrina]